MKNKKKKNSKQISIYIENDIYQALRRYSFEKNIKYAALIRKLLQTELKKSGYFPRMKEK